MALKALIINRKIENARKQLEELETREKVFRERSSEAEQAITEAETEEEMEAVIALSDEIEAEGKDLKTEREGLEKIIAQCEAELAEIKEKEPDKARSLAEPAAVVRTIITGGHEMIKRGFFAGLSTERRAAIVGSEEVREFLERVRSLGKENRAIKNADVNIPDTLLGMLRDNLHRYSKLISKVHLAQVPGVGRQNILGQIPEGIWTEMCATLNELSLFFNQVEVDGYKVGGFIPVCNAVLEDSDINLANEIMDAIGQAIGLALDKAILYGLGKKMPLGIVVRLMQTAEPSDWYEKAPTWTDLHESNVITINPTKKTMVEFYSELILAMGKAKPNYSNGDKFWCMNSTTYALLQAKALVVNSAGAIVSAQNHTMPIIGGEVVILEFIPDNDIIGGYGSLYLLAQRAGVKLAQSEHVQFIEDNTVFKGTARYDGQPVIGEAFVVININNVAPTTAIAFAPDTANENKGTGEGGEPENG